MKPTPKQRVMRKHPSALAAKYWVAHSSEWWWLILPTAHSTKNLGTGPTPAAAWKDAAERMK